MTRDPGRLRGRFDLVVVGGGIHGLFAAYEAATRGLSVALVERGDFGGGISFNHQRTLHGGLRSLQSGRLDKCRAQVAERRAWARMAPHLIRPLPFLLGTYRGSRRSRTLIRAGFWLYDTVGRHRNQGVLPELHLPKGRLESAAATRRLFPGIAEPGLSGGAIWYDYQTIHPDRLTWCVALAAAQAGAVLVNYAEAVSLTRDAGRVSGLDVRDLVSGETLGIESPAILLAAGAGLPALHDAWQLGPAPPLVRAMNLLIDRPARDIALAASAASGRMYTAVPWQGRVLTGTYQAPNIASAGDPLAPDAEVDACLAEVNSAFPALEARRSDVRFIHAAFVPATTNGGHADLLADFAVLTSVSAPGVTSLVGVKYTTARLAASAAVDRATGTTTPGRTGTAPLPHADVADAEGLLIEGLRRAGRQLDRDVISHLAGWYGTEAPAVIDTAAEVGFERLGDQSPVLGAEVVHAARSASVVTLADIVFRRTPLASAGDPGAAALTAAAGLAAGVLHWTPARAAEELAAVQARLTGAGMRGTPT